MAIFFLICMQDLSVGVYVCVFSRSVLSDSFATPWTVTGLAPLSMGFPRQEYWSRLPFPTPADLPDPGIKPRPREGKIPWRRKWQPAPVFLPGKSLGQRSLAGQSPRGLKELDMTG